MISKHFDVVKVSDQCHQLHSAGKMFKVEFNQDDNKKHLLEYY